MKEELDVNPTGQALADLIHEEQKILAKEIRWHEFELHRPCNEGQRHSE